MSEYELYQLLFELQQRIEKLEIKDYLFIIPCVLCFVCLIGCLLFAMYASYKADK